MLHKENKIKQEEINYNTKLNNKLNYDNSFWDNNDISNNTSLEMNLNNIYLEKQEKNNINHKKQKQQIKHLNKEPIITEEFKEIIEDMIDKQFELQYNELNNYYEQKVEELLNEQEKIFNKNQILKQKFNSLVKYIKNYCRKANIDYEALLTN